MQSADAIQVGASLVGPLRDVGHHVTRRQARAARLKSYLPSQSATPLWTSVQPNSGVPSERVPARTSTPTDLSSLATERQPSVARPSHIGRLTANPDGRRVVFPRRWHPSWRREILWAR
jgi:hypothetical protein